MGTEPGDPRSSAFARLQEWQRLAWAEMNRAMGHYLDGCANVALARTPMQVIAALHETHAVLLVHSAQLLTDGARLWRAVDRKGIAPPGSRSAR